MARDLISRFTAGERNGVPVVADEQRATVARFSTPESAAQAASKMERGVVTLDTYHWHEDPNA